MSTDYPETPAEIARTVLEQLDRDPSMLSMDTWLYQAKGSMSDLMAGPGYQPTDNPWEDGTIMCAASWVAHVTGWTIQHGAAGRCSKGDDVDFVSDVARRALGLRGPETFWFASNGDAFDRLKEIART